MPPHGVETSVARGLLPDAVPHADAAAANAGRAALLVAALTRQPELLLAATEDRLHQDYPEPAMPLHARAGPRAACRRPARGGLGCRADGAGAHRRPAAAAVVAARAPAGWQALVVPLDRRGARVDLPEEAPQG